MRGYRRYMNKGKTGIIGNRSGLNTFDMFDMHRPILRDGQI